MKDYLNRIEYPNGNITIKLVKMGMDIDDTRNHRVRGIVTTEDSKSVFIEILQGSRMSEKYSSLSHKEYLEKYPNEEYIWIDGCFRVDIPEDYYKNYTTEFSNYDRHSFYEYTHNKENIIKILQNFNKNITDIELVDNNYLDEYCDKNGFYRLYDDRLEHSLIPNKITKIYGKNIYFDLTYSCANFDKTVTYTENKEVRYDFNLSDLNKLFGADKMESLLSDYEKESKNRRSIAEKQKNETKDDIEEEIEK